MKKIVSLILFSSLYGCASVNTPSAVENRIEQTSDLIDLTLVESSQPNQVKLEDAPEDILQELSDSMQDPVTSGVFADEYQKQQRFDLSVSNAPAETFFMSLVKGSPDNMAVHPSVKGEISLDLKNVTIKEVMDLVREVYGYEYKKTQNGYIVLATSILTKVFHVNYLNITRGGNTNMTVSSGQQTSGSSSSSSNSDDSSSSSSSSASSGAASANIVTTTTSDFWSSLKVTLDALVGTGNGRSVIVDAHTNLVVIKAMPSEMRDVEEYLTQAQANLQRQVIIEAKIIEVTLSESYQSGIDWAALASGSKASAFIGQAGFNGGTANALDSSGVFNAANILASTQPGLSNLLAFGVGGDDFSAIIKMLGTQGDVQVLSSPRISTINNQKAVIKVGSDEYFVTGISSSDSSDDGSTTSTSDAEIERFFSGIALDVTPQISQDNEVILHIHPSVSDVSTQTKNFTVNGQTQSLPLAFSKVRESDTIIKAKNSQVVVIGGLMQNDTSDSNAGIPLLGDIPILGNLFSQTDKSNSRSELIILLKPIVVGKDSDWSDYIKGTNQRIRNIRQAPKSEEK